MTLVLEPDPSMRSVPKAFWVYLDMIIVLAFTAELAARFYLCPSRFKFWWPISMNWAGELRGAGALFHHVAYSDSSSPVDLTYLNHRCDWLLPCRVLQISFRSYHSSWIWR